MTYELCNKFKCLPSQLDQEDAKTIEELIIVMNTINEHSQKDDRKKKRKELSQKVGGGQRR
jgi:hypothetical protein